MNNRIKYIWKYAKRYKLQLIMILVLILVTTCIVAVYPYIFGELIDTLYYKKSFHNFLGITALYCFIFLINQILHFILDMTYANLQTKFIFDIKRNVFNRVLLFKGENLTNIKTGDIVNRINKDSDEVMNFIYSDVFYGLSALLDFIVCLGMVVFIKPTLAAIALLLAIFSFILSAYFSKRLWPINKKIAQSVAMNTSWVYEILSAMRDIKLLNAQTYCIDKYLKTEKEIWHLNNQKVREETIAERSNEAMSLIDKLCIFLVSAYFIITNNFTIGAMVACIDYFSRITLMLNRLYYRTFSISSRMVSIDRLIELEKEEIEDGYTLSSPKEIRDGEIEFNKVVFAYQNRLNVLNEFSLHIHSGEVVALVGKSGAGKSTIAELLCRLFEVDAGEITIDNININQYNLHDLRKQIGIIHQEKTIFNQSIRYNLVFTNETRDDERIWDALRKSRIDDVIEELPNGLDTILGFGGTSLSGGQEQRLMLARLYLKQSKIIILDESTSALDEKTENDIIDIWLNMHKFQTTLIIAHRFSTIMKADFVAYLEDGNIIGYGKHSELIKSCAQYNKLYMEQEQQGNRIQGDYYEENTF